jgi:hypothetical protein
MDGAFSRELTAASAKPIVLAMLSPCRRTAK